MVSVLVSRASAMRSSGQPGPPSAASALSRMRAWVSFWAAALPAAISSCNCWRSSAVRVTLYFFMGSSRCGDRFRRADTGASRKSKVAGY